jgi:hypothetical protein
MRTADDLHSTVAELPGNHVIARQSHEETERSLREGPAGPCRSTRRRARAGDEDANEGVWDELPATDRVEEASMESFPASDPPAYVSIHA